jgi:hypothetical protein
MAQTIKCKHCGKEIEVSEALTHQLEEQITASLESKNKLQLEEYRKEIEKKASKDIEEEKQQNKKLNKQVSELLDEIRALRRRDDEREIEMKKKLLDEEEKIRKEAIKKAEEDHRIKDSEKDKKLQDAINANEELRRKLEQGSQQTQGEALELELEERLASEFPMDSITEVKKGQRGADVVQGVVDKLNRKCGTILWESKNAKWSAGWIKKLKEDQRQAKAEIAVLVSVDLPEDVETFSYMNGVWVVGANHYLSLALALRYNLVSLYHEKQNQEGQDEKMQVLYQYLTGAEFKHRVEAIVEAFSNMQDELEREKRWFNTKWARQEKEIRKVMDHTHGMYGDLQGVIGRSLPEIKTLEIEDGE